MKSTNLPEWTQIWQPFTTVLIAFGSVSIPVGLAAQSEAAIPTIDWLQLGMELFGGLALFLAGLEVLSEGLKQAAGSTLRTVLGKLTVNRFLGALTGAFVTGILNSSSVTTVLVVGFVTAGVMTLSQSVGVIMGANIGSTVTAQILAFNISAYALIPIAIGFFVYFADKSERSRQVGLMVMGFGLVFYGMGLMSEGMTPLRSYEPFLGILREMENPVFGILAGAVFTGLVQSSAATVGIAIAMASEGFLTLPAGIALALGANIGTCITALLASLGKPTEAVRAAVVHISFNILGVIVWLPVLPLLADLAIAVSPVGETGLAGRARLAAEVPRQIANANSLFNILNTIIFIGFTTAFARLAQWLVPERPLPKGVVIRPQFLDEAALKVPAVALENVRQEIQRTGKIAVSIMDELATVFATLNTAGLAAVTQHNREVDTLDTEILAYLAEIRKILLTEDESHDHEALMTAMVNLESLADVLGTDLVNLVTKFIQRDLERGSEETREMVRGLWQSVYRSVELAVQAVGCKDPSAAQTVVAMKFEIRDLADRLFNRHANRLASDDPRYLERVRMLLTFVEQLRHIYTLAKRMARTQLPASKSKKSGKT